MIAAQHFGLLDEGCSFGESRVALAAALLLAALLALELCPGLPGAVTRP